MTEFDESTAAAQPAAASTATAARTPGWWMWLANALRHEPAHALTIAYFAISALGVWGSFWFFRAFGIAILDYMDPADYLTAGLRDPVYFLIVLAAFGFALLVTWPARLFIRDPQAYAALRARSPLLAFLLREDPTQVRWMRRLNWKGFTPVGALLFGTVVATFTWTMSWAQTKAERIKAGGGHPVRLTIVHTHEPQPGTARMLGTIGEFVFLYWPADHRAEAVEVESASRLQSLTRAQARAIDAAVVASPHASDALASSSGSAAGTASPAH